MVEAMVLNALELPVEQSVSLSVRDERTKCS